MKQPQLEIFNTIDFKDINIESVEENTLYENCTFTNSYERVRFNASYLKKCAFEDLDLERAEFIDCIIENCDFSNLYFDHATFHRCIFRNCKFLAASLYKSSLKDSLFNNCMMNYINFSETKSTNVIFKDSLLIDSSFQKINHNNLVFEGVELGDVDMMDTKLKGIDLSKSEFKTLNYSSNLGKGLVIRMDQGLILLAQLGIVVE